jgi:hypothetical protein
MVGGDSFCFDDDPPSSWPPLPPLVAAAPLTGLWADLSASPSLAECFVILVTTNATTATTMTRRRTPIEDQRSCRRRFVRRPPALAGGRTPPCLASFRSSSSSLSSIAHSYLVAWATVLLGRFIIVAYSAVRRSIGTPETQKMKKIVL